MAFPRTRKSLISFNGGELSPKMDARNDTEKYQSGCRQMQNFLPLTHGGAIRRRGLEFIAASKYDDAAKPARVLRFQFSQSDGVIMEFGDFYIRFFTREGQVMDTGSPYEIESPYSAAQVFALQISQINDVVYIAHPLFSPMKLVRLAEASWTLTTPVFNRPALLDENVTTTTLAAAATTGTGIALVASAAVFDALNVGGYYQIGHHRDSNVIDTPITSTQTVALGSILGKWTVNTYGTWTAVIKVQNGPTNTGPWETVRTYTSKADANISDTGEQVEKAAFYQLVITYTSSSGSPAPRIIFGIADGIVYGLVKITAVADSTHATATIVNDLYSTTATVYWSEGAWSNRRGFPTSVCFFQQRLWFAGSSYQPQTFWGSVTGSYEDFTLGSNADSGLAFTLSSTERSQILWMVGQKKLVLGTSGGIYAAYGDELEASITATKPPLILLQSQYPMAYQRAVLVNSAILAIQSSGVKVREMVFDGQQGIYTANDLTVLADHIGAGGILTPCQQMNRDSILWAVTGAGLLISMTYEKQQNVIAWARHTTDGIFESVDTIKGDIDDDVWVSVRRNVNGTWKRFIERMKGYYNPSVDVYKPVAQTGAGAGANAQIAFAIDTTGSMGAIINAIKAQVAAIATAYDAFYDDVKFGLINFKDETDPMPILDFTDLATFTTAVNLLTASGGGDNPEDGYGAIVNGVNNMSWQNGKSHLMLLFTDTDSHERGNTLAEAAAALASQSIVFSYGPYQNVPYDSLKTATGGHNITSIDDITASLFSKYSGADAGKVFVDSYVLYAGPPITSVSGLSHLEGETVSILADGLVIAPRVVTGGAVTLGVPSSIVQVGLPYESVLQPMRLDTDPQAGSSQALVKRIQKLAFRMIDSGLPFNVASAVGKTATPVKNGKAAITSALFNGEIDNFDFTADYDYDATFIISQAKPLPMTLLGVIVKYQITES